MSSEVEMGMFTTAYSDKFQDGVQFKHGNDFLADAWIGRPFMNRLTSGDTRHVVPDGLYLGIRSFKTQEGGWVYQNCLVVVVGNRPRAIEIRVDIQYEHLLERQQNRLMRRYGVTYEG